LLGSADWFSVPDVVKLFQWMIVDYKEFKPGQKVNNNTFWVLDQIPYALQHIGM
jgi:hypothetical protein